MSDLMAFIRQFLADSWRFFQIEVPATGFTFAQVLIGIGLFNVGFSVLGILLGVHLPDLGDFVESRARVKDIFKKQPRLPRYTTRYRASKERANDEK